jgi:replicative DNA helicase
MTSRIPAHDLELESIVLGAILLDGKAMTSALGHIGHERFYDRRHGTIFEAMTELYVQNKPIDLLTVTQVVRKKKLLDQCGGPAYIAALTNRVASTSNLEEWCMLISEHYMKREFARISAQVNEQAYDASADVFDIFDRFSSQISAVFSTNVKTSVSHVNELTESVANSVISRETDTAGVSGFTTGISEVDKIIGAHQKSDLMYMAGRPGMGKTAMAISEMLSLALRGVPVVFFSLEMSSSQVILRLISMMSGLDGAKVMKYRLTTDEMRLFQHTKDRLNKLPIYIDDTAGVSIFDLRTRVKTMVTKYKVAIVYIDYVQLMTVGTQLRKNGSNREQELSLISRNLKLIAKECDVPVVALSQLSRGVESRSEKRPMLSDLRESGSLEQDADVVVFLFRPEYYGFKVDESGNGMEGVGEYIVAKQRNGSTGIARIRFKAEVMQYVDFNQNTNTPTPF